MKTRRDDDAALTQSLQGDASAMKKLTIDLYYI